MGKPFIRWPGGKTKMLDLLLRAAPKDFGSYHEPFVGGGAMFFALQEKGLIRKAYLSDILPRLIKTYAAVRDDVERVIDYLKTHVENHSSKWYYQVRREFNGPLPEDKAKVAAQLIYLNKTCFNGLYRTNKTGKFNSPFGKFDNPKILDEETLREASAALQFAEIGTSDALTPAIDRIAEGDFVFLDPPYLPVDGAASFTTYAPMPFGVPEHERLAGIMRELGRKGARVLCTNAMTKETQRIYSDFRIVPTPSLRVIGGRKSSRTRYTDAIITNYPW